MSEISKAINGQEKSIQAGDEKSTTVLEFTNFKRSTDYVFAEYLRSGWRFTLAAGIDFSASNGFIKDPISLHYIGDERPDDQNLYLKVISEIFAHI